MKFIAIDFETANSFRGSPCEIGIVKVEDFQVVDQKSYLIRPKDNFFDFFNTNLHGIDEKMVENEPEFDVIFEELRTDFKSYPIIAHNAAFDISVLRHTLDLYGMEYPETNYSCTYQMSKQAIDGLLSFRLDSICRHYGIELEHHRALSDALGCANIALKIFEEKEIKEFVGIKKKLNLSLGQLTKDGYRPSLTKSEIHEIEVDESKFQPDNPFFGQTVVFTGTLNSMTRKEAQLKVLEIGGLCGKGLSTATNFLVIGGIDYARYGEGHKSTKMKKAEALLAKGNQIELLTESQFLEMIID